MVHGRPDYWQGTLVGFPTPGSGQSDIIESDAATISGEDDDDLINYTVPDGFILYVTSLMVTCNAPYLQRARFSIDGSFVDDVYYYLTKQWGLHSSGLYVATEGEVVLMRMYNQHADEHDFAVTMVGFLETG